MAARSRILFTLGDPNGIGPEVLLRGWSQLCNICRPYALGHRPVLEYYARRFGLPMPDARQILEPETPAPQPNPGALCASAGRASADCIRLAVQLLQHQRAEAMVTLPINKESLNLGGAPYPGHTEMLGDLTGCRQQSMMLAGGDVRIVLVTTHMPLSEVARTIDEQRVFRTLQNTYDGLQQLGFNSPRIAVCGLNPHAGDGGILGDEEQRIIAPAIAAWDEHAGSHTQGPLPADALFARLVRERCWDAVVCMYHDQGLIPVKMAAFGEAVNITLGLPIIRTSVDHGTAFDIAGTGVAGYGSLLQATRYALNMITAARSRAK